MREGITMSCGLSLAEPIPSLTPGHMSVGATQKVVMVMAFWKIALLKACCESSLKACIIDSILLYL